MEELELSLHSAEDTDVDDDSVSDEDSELLPSMIIITLFSAGVPSKHASNGRYLRKSERKFLFTF